jgi:hypothetical protein
MYLFGTLQDAGNTRTVSLSLWKENKRKNLHIRTLELAINRTFMQGTIKLALNVPFSTAPILDDIHAQHCPSEPSAITFLSSDLLGTAAYIGCFETCGTSLE